MSQFLSPSALVLLIPLSLLGTFLYRRRKKVQRIAERMGWSATSGRFIDGILLVICLILVIAVSRPYWGYEEVPVSSEGDSIVVAVDVSHSMLVQDMAPNRLSVAKRKLRDLLAALATSGKSHRVGIVLFAGAAYVYCPPTEDLKVVDVYARSIDSRLIEAAGSSLHQATVISAESLANSGGGERWILAVTDGEDETFDPTAINKVLAEKKIRFAALGVGTTEGALVPDPRTGSYHKDSLGNSVLGRLNESSLKQLVAANGGQYERVGVGDGDIVSLVKVLGVQGSSSNNKSQDPSARKVIVIYNELGWLLCAISLVLLAYVCFKAPQTMALCLLLFWSFFNCNFLRAEDQEVTIAPSERAAFEAYEKGDYGTAKLGFENALGSGDTAKRRLRAGSADFKLGNFESAAKHFAEAEKLAQNGREKFESLYDAGNVALAVRQFDRAIEMYDKALALKSGDEAARGNQALARQLLQQEQQKQEQKQDKSGKPEESKESSKSQEGQGSEDQQDQGKEADSSHRPQDSAQSQSNNQSSDDHKNTEGEESKESGDQQQGQVKSADDPATNDQSSGQQDPSDEQAEQQSAKGVANDDKQSDTDRGSQEQQPQETPNPSPSANPEYPKETEAASSARPGVEDQKSNGTPDGSESENGGSDPAVSEPEGKEVKGSSSSAKTNAGSKQLSSAELKAEAAKRWLDSLPDSPILLQRHAGESFGGSQEW